MACCFRVSFLDANCIHVLSLGLNFFCLFFQDFLFGSVRCSLDPRLRIMFYVLIENKRIISNWPVSRGGLYPPILRQVTIQKRLK